MRNINVVVGIVGIGLDRGNPEFGPRVEQHMTYLSKIPGYSVHKYNTPFDACWELSRQRDASARWIVVLAEKPITHKIDEYPGAVEADVHMLVLTSQYGDDKDPSLVTHTIDRTMLASRRKLTMCAHVGMASHELCEILDLKAAA